MLRTIGYDAKLWIIFQRYVKSLRDFCAYFHEVYIHGVFWP